MKEEQGLQQNEKTEIPLAEILFLNPEIKKGLHPYAAECYYKWLVEVFDEISQLTTDEKVNVDVDLDTYLNDADKALVKKYKQNILEWLHKCTNIGGGYSPYPYDRWVTSNMIGLKSLIKKAYKARAEKLEAERKEREDSERWCAAYIAIKPPNDDAKKYLNDKDYEKFERATWKAVDVYMEKGEDYLDDSGTFDYRQCLWKINYRKERERQQKAADFTAREFNNSLSKHIAELKSKLSNKPRDLQNYFTAKIQDKRYTGHNFNDVLDNEQKRVFDATLVRVANDKLKQIIPPDLLEFIQIPSTYYRFYFPLPLIEEYRNEGVPCLDFCFEIFATAYGRVLLTPKEKKFGICRFNLPAKKEGNVLVPLEEPKLLGYFYVFLRPEELGGYVPFEAIPLFFFNWLLKGGAKPAGVTISAASDGIITYKIAKFKEEVTIPDKFAACLKSIGSFDDLLNMGWVIETVANIARSQIGELKVEQEVSPQKDKIERKDTGKARVFRLFDEGKRPSDREVKATKIKSQILYRYYQEWKRLSANNKS